MHCLIVYVINVWSKAMLILRQNYTGPFWFQKYEKPLLDVTGNFEHSDFGLLHFWWFYKRMQVPQYFEVGIYIDSHIA